MLGLVRLLATGGSYAIPRNEASRHSFCHAGENFPKEQA